MRSCGGAVQGIREPFGEDSFYLNRADDGFVFYDNGSYTYGPVKKTEGCLYLANLMVGNSRILISSKSDHQGLLRDTTATYQTGTYDGSECNIASIHLDPDPSCLDLVFTSKLVCSMPSAGQCWMLQRVKWELEKTDCDEHGSFLEKADATIRCWSVSQPAEEFYNWIGLSDKLGGVVLHMGFACEETSVAGAVARHYTTDGVLHRVLLLDARLARKE
eukprot:scaffold2334_cov118-Cylindrotheca_fusiformis.AAC.10